MVNRWGPGEGAGKKEIMKIPVVLKNKLDTGVFSLRGLSVPRNWNELKPEELGWGESVLRAMGVRHDF